MSAAGTNYTIINRKKGRVCRVRVWDQATGKQVSQSFKIPDDIKGNKAKQFCEEKAREVEFRVTFRTSPTSPRITFEKFFFGEWWEEASKTNCPPTMQDYGRYYNKNLKDLIGGVPLDKITPNTLNGVYQALRDKGLSDSYVHRMHKLISQVLGEAKRRKILTVNVARECMHAPKKPRPLSPDEKPKLNEQQCARLLDAVNEEPIYWKTLYYILFFTGMRREEVAALTWESYFANDRQLKIENAVRRMCGENLMIKETKSVESRRNLGETWLLTKIIDEWNKECGGPRSGFMSFSFKVPGAPIHPDSITVHTRKLSEKLGFYFTVHMFRHTFISMAIGVLNTDSKVVQSIAGHSDCRITMGIYATSHIEHKVKVQEAYQNHFKAHVRTGPINLNDADENFSLVSYVKSNIVEHPKTSIRPKLDPKFSETSFGTVKMGVLYIDLMEKLEPPEEFESPTC